MADIGKRKSEHLDIVLNGDVAPQSTGTGLDAVQFEHVAAPELDYDAIDLSAEFLGYKLSSPFLISSMTGGPQRAIAINLCLAQAAQTLGIALAVGSQRIAVEGGADGGFTRELRARAPDIPILANLGAAQIRGPRGAVFASNAVTMIDANALIIHLNPLQEAVQAGGDRNWTGVLASIERLVEILPVPIIVKEVGCGLSGSLAQRLTALGVTILDVAGVGGTSWAAVEGLRSENAQEKAIALAFRDWGVPTATALRGVRAACPQATIIASGGLKTGIDAAKAIRLGANLCGFAASILPAALVSPETLVNQFEVLTAQLRIACFCTGSRDLRALAQARLLGDDQTTSAPPIDRMQRQLSASSPKKMRPSS